MRRFCGTFYSQTGYDEDSTNLEKFVNLRSLDHASSLTTTNQMLYYGCPYCNPEILKLHPYQSAGNVDNLYLTDWKQDDLKHNLDFLLLSIISPNVTIFLNIVKMPTQLPTLHVTISADTSSDFMFDQKGIYFVHCSEIVDTNGLSLYGYISAFDVPTWTALLWVIWMTAVFLTFYLNKKGNFGNESEVENKAYDIASFAYQILLE